MLNTPSNTFAKHVLGRAATGLAAQAATGLAAQTATGLAATKVEKKARPAKPAKAATSRPATTYASVVLMMAIGAASTANAATDGDVARAGGASTGHVGISLIIPERIEARGLHTIVQQPLAGSGVVGEAMGCIFGRGSGGYSVSVHADGPYELSYAANDGAAHVVKTSADSVPSDGARLDGARFDGAGAMGCADGETNARLRLAMTNAEANVAGSSVNGLPALTLVISPE